MSIENVSGANTPKVKFADLPKDLQTKLSGVESAEERQSIMTDFLTQNRKTLDDDAFASIINFQKAEADEEAQQRSAAAQKKAVDEINAQKEAAKMEQRKADLESGDPAKVAEATVAQAQDNLAKATKLAEENPNDPKMQEQKAKAEAELENAKQAFKDVVNNDGGKLGISRIRGEQVTQDQAGNVKTQKIDDAAVNYNLGVPQEAGQKWKKDDARAEFNRYTNNTGHDFEIKDKDGNVVDVIKAGEEVSGDRLKALKKQVDADYKAAEKAHKQALKDRPYGSETEGLGKKAQQLKEERDMIRAAESGKGIGRITKTHNKNVKANQNLIDTQVFYTKEEEKAAKDATKAAGQEIKTKVAEPRDLHVIEHLAKTAYDKIKAAPEGERPTTEALWGELASLYEFDDKGNIISGNPDPEKVKNALIDITGGGAQLSISEMKIVAHETGCSDGDVRHAFRAFGFEAERPIGKKIVNGLKSAAPAAALTLASVLIKNRKTAKADAHAHDEKTVNFHAEDTQTVSGVATNTTTTNTVTPGYTIETIDPETGRTITQEIAGSVETTTSTTSTPYSATAHAQVSGSVTAVADASVQAIATAVAKGTPLLGGALAAYEFIKGLVKTPYEKSVVDMADTYKLTHYTDMYKGADNKKMASQIQQMVGGLTGDRDMDAKIITAVLKQESGSQNTVLDKRELEAAYQDLKEIQRNFRNAKAADLSDVKEPEKPVEPPVVEPEVKEKPEIHKHDKVKANFKFDVLGAGPEAYAEACYGVRPGSPEFKAVMNALYEQNPGLKGQNYKLNTPVFMPVVELEDGRKLEPDLKKRPAKGQVKKVKVGYKGNQGNNEYWGPGKTHTEPHAEMTKEQAEEAARKKQKE